MPPKRKIIPYESDAITVLYDVKRCLHAAACIQRLGQVFDSSKRPWVQPEQADAGAIGDTIHHCPTGALQYRRKDGAANEPTPAENHVRMVADGPLYLRGDYDLVTADGTPIGHEHRLALCRCGASQNKPFCDNSHLAARFAEPGIPAPDAEAVADMSSAGGRVTITPTTNGPLVLTGAVEIFNASGEHIFRGDECWLCRCGGSQHKPFCDDTHMTNGFQAE